MAFWDRWFGSSAGAQSAPDAKLTTLELFNEVFNAGNTSASGAVVNVKTALEATVALACARVISEGLSQIPFRLMQEQGTTRRPALDHPVYPLIADAPNEWQTSVEMLDQLGMHLVFLGNAYVMLVRDSRDRIVELLPLEPSTVEVDLDQKTWRLSYKVSLDNQTKVAVAARNIWHLRGPTWCGWFGLEGVKLAREAIGLALTTEKHGATTFSNGARLGGVLSTDKDLSKEQLAMLRTAWQTAYAGAENAGKVAVLGSGMKFMANASTNIDAQFIETRKYQVEEVCRAFRVMPIMVGFSDKAQTYASAEQMFLAHAVYTMGPWYRRLEASARMALLSDDERRGGYYFKFFNQALLRGASKDRAAFYATLYGIGAINPNEIRALEDMNPYDGGERFAVPLNMTDPNEQPDGVPGEDDDAQA